MVFFSSAIGLLIQSHLPYIIVMYYYISYYYICLQNHHYKLLNYYYTITALLLHYYYIIITKGKSCNNDYVITCYAKSKPHHLLIW